LIISIDVIITSHIIIEAHEDQIFHIAVDPLARGLVIIMNIDDAILSIIGISDFVVRAAVAAGATSDDKNCQ
jgi:ABC-type arginine transport system permease subunit